MTDFNTKLVHGIPVGDNQTGAVVPPIYQSTTFAYPQADAKVRWDYTRSGNPTREYLEKEIAYLEDGDAGFAFSSGLAAISTVFSIFDRDDHIIIGDSVYGGTYRLLNDYFTKHGLSFTTVDTAWSGCDQSGHSAEYPRDLFWNAVESAAKGDER